MENLKVYIDGYGYGDGYGPGNGYGNGDGNGAGDDYGNGYGNGNGYGAGYDYCNGNGNGNGYGAGDGSGNGSGDGNGSLSEFVGHTVLYIDKIPTVLTQTKGFFGKGFIINKDYTTKACYVARTESNSHYAHGDTLKAAHKALQDKIFANLNAEQKMEEFLKAFCDNSKKYAASEFSKWHYLITGSCGYGRKNFMSNNNIQEEDGFTVSEFLTLIKNEFGFDKFKIIKRRIENEK